MTTRKLRIFLADLIHTRHNSSFGVPLNIAYVAATLKQRVGDAVETTLYKFPDDLISALQASPEVLALSNYDWNVNLNHAIISIARKINPDVVIIMGGPNIRKSQEGIRQFILSNPVDLYVVNEGEDGFCQVVEHFLSKWPCNLKETIDGNIAIPNVAYLAPGTNALVLGTPPSSSKANPIPFTSPWLSGFLDSFLNSSLFPMSAIVETNRGCPYQCSYCTWGNLGGKIRKFDLDTVFEELRYIFQKTQSHFELIVADANFGVFDRDIEIAEEIRRLSDRHRNVTYVEIWQAKNNVERNLEVAKILRDLAEPDFAVQTFNKNVLENIGRKNIKTHEMGKYLSEGLQNGLRLRTDLLLGLPGETKQSHIDSMKKAIDIGFTQPHVGDIRLLAGSIMEEDDDRKKYGIESRHRVVPGAYGEYGGLKVVEYEECVRKTDAMSENDILGLRLFHANFFLLYSIELGRPLLDFSDNCGLHPINLISKISKQPPKTKFPLLYRLVDQYLQQAKSEWFDSEEKANEYYLQEDIFKKLESEGFPKLNYDYAAQLILDIDLRKEYVNWIGDNIINNFPNKKSIVDDITQFCVQRVYRLPISSSQRVMKLSWESVKELGSDYFSNNEISYDDKNELMVRLMFDGNKKKERLLERKIQRNGGASNLSKSIQVILETDRVAFLMDPPRVQLAYHSAAK